MSYAKVIGINAARFILLAQNWSIWMTTGQDEAHEHFVQIVIGTISQKKLLAELIIKVKHFDTYDHLI